MTYWKDKVVVITGGSAGLGLELARAVRRRHGNVALLARDAQRLRAAKLELSDQLLSDDDSERSVTTPDKSANDVREQNVAAFPVDITDAKQVEKCVVDVLAKFGRVDALINCAGKSARGEVLQTTSAEFRDLFELNFVALASCTSAFMPALKTSHGHVVNVGSLASKSTSRFLGAYPASKFPVAAYSQQLRLELDGSGVHILLVCPGPIARSDSGTRYDGTDVPAAAQKPGGGVKLKGLDAERLAGKILRACERRQLELILPAKARWLFLLSQLSPRWADWLITKMTRSK